MAEFISKYPEVVMFIIGGLFTFITLIGGALITMLKRAFDDLREAIKGLNDSINGEKIEIGTLKDRMQAQETTCKMQRELCPSQGCPNPTMVHRRNGE